MPETMTPTEKHIALQAARAAEADPATAPPPEGAAPEAGASPPRSEDAAPVVQFAIVGYTPTCLEAMPLLDDPTWEVWGMNNLHLQPAFQGKAAKFDAWFDLHPTAAIAKDEAHARWLASGADGVPVWVWQAPEEWPTARPYPRDEVLLRFGRYFTNTVSWQLALALLRIMAHSPDGHRAPEGSRIAVFGIDMATSSEYAAQRPSVEYFLGIATGAGVEVVLPERSDLLKAANLYGESDGGFRAKLEERMEHLTAQLAEQEQIAGQAQANVHALRGAKDQVAYFMGVWTQPSIDRDAPHNQPAQDGAAPPT